MPSLLISDFKYGVDRRRPRVAGVPGTLWAGVNCHISRGGDVQRAKKFVPTYTDLEGTFGLGQINGQLFVFGSDDLAAEMPNGVQYQRLIPVGEVLATGTVTITGGTSSPGTNKVSQVTVDGAELLDAPVDWTSSHSATATAVADAINNGTGTHGFTAEANSAIVTITAPAGTGASVNGDVVAAVVEGDVTASTANMSGGADGPSMVGVLWSDTFNNKHYVIAEYDDGNIHHFYDGTRVDDWDTFDSGGYSVLADYMARKVAASGVVDALSFGGAILLTATTPGVAFTIDGDAVDDPHGQNGDSEDDQTIDFTTVQANVAEVAEVRATGTVTITAGTRDAGVNKVTQITVDGVSLMGAAVDWITSHSATATAVAVEINNGTSTHGYSASALGAVVTLQAAPGTGATPNGDVVAVTVAGDVTAGKTNIASGVAYVAPVAQVVLVEFGGTVENEDRFTITVDDVDYVATVRASNHGTSGFIYKSRVYVTAASLIRYCKLNDPTDWTDSTESTGAGFINVANDASGNEVQAGLASYETSVAAFARSSIRIYNLFADAEENALVQPLDNTGTIAPNSVAAIPSPTGDVLYLDEPGIRALRVRDVNSNAYVGDSGSQIDPLVTEWVSSLSEAVVGRAVGVIEPLDGRYMLAIGSRMFVLSYFPSAKINAWTYYEPGFTASAFARVNRRLYARDEDTIYLLGGPNGATYPDDDEQNVIVALPFAGAKNPAQFKNWKGVDVACENVWDIDLLVDPENDAKFINIGRINGTTYGLQDIAALGEHPQFAALLTCATAGFASLSSFIAHYDSDEEAA
jgi:hypothetical protein